MHLAFFGTILFYLFIFTEFIGVTLVNKPWSFRVYNSIKHNLHTSLCARHPNSSLFPSSLISSLPLPFLFFPLLPSLWL